MKIKQHSNGYYYAHIWTEAGTRSVSLHTKDRTQAVQNAKQAKIAEQEQAGKVRALTHETFARILVGRKQTGAAAFEHWKQWAKTVGLGRNTRERYGLYIDLFLRVSGFDSRSLAACQPRHVDEFVNPVDSEVVAATRRNRLAALHSLFGVACAHGFVASNPTAAIKVKLEGLTFEQKEGADREPFTEDELKKLRTLDDPFHKTVVVLGEAYGLRLGDVAMLERAAVNYRKGSIIVWTDKRDARIELPLTEAVRRHLQALPVTHEKFFFPEQRAVALDTKLRAKLSVYFGRDVKRLGIEDKTAHNLRHTFATQRHSLGDTVDEIREKLGHRLSETTERYIHPEAAA